MLKKGRPGLAQSRSHHLCLGKSKEADWRRRHLCGVQQESLLRGERGCRGVLPATCIPCGSVTFHIQTSLVEVHLDVRNTLPWSWEGLGVDLSCPDHGLAVSCFAGFQVLIAWRPWRRFQGYLGPGKAPGDSSGCPQGCFSAPQGSHNPL